MGITHDPETETPFGNVYWAFDGLNSSLIRFDFQEPHGPGSLDHSIAAIRRYPEIELTRVPGVPGHLMMDPTERVLYIADTGGGRILRMDPDSGHFIRTAKREFPIYSSTAETFEYSIYGCSDWEVFADGLDEPSGLHISEGFIYVTEHGNGKITAFDRVTGEQVDQYQTGAEKLLGIQVDGEGSIWFVDGARNEVSKLVVEQQCEDGSVTDHNLDVRIGGYDGWRVQDYEEVSAVVGQRLVFDFEEFHDVIMMADEAAFDACDFSSAIRLADVVDSPFTLLLQEADTLYFSDSTGMHCQAGQKVKVTVTEVRMVWADRECTMVVDNDLTVDVHAHSAGYMNLTGFLGISDYADAEVHHCGGNSVTLSAAMAGMPTADESGNYRMNNDALLMEGYMCHVCLPAPCANGGVCSHIPWGFTCDCSGTGFGGDTCEKRLPVVPCAPAFGRSSADTVMATAEHGLAHPRDLQFHPLNPNELWVANNDTDSITIIDTVAGTAATRRDRAPYHYMERISSLAFDSRGYFATCQESENSYDGMMVPNWFMGPTLFHSEPTELINQLGEPGCDTTDPDRTCFFTHWDMLHESPLCMGITHDPETETPFGNVYWAFDGLNSSLIRFDFQEPHGPGSLDHSIAAIRRYPEIELTRVPGVPGHLMMDPTERVLYIADTGGGRILRMDPDSGHFIRTAKREFPIYSSTAETFEYSIYGCSDWEVFADGLDEPSGLHISEGFIYVTEHGNGKITAFDRVTGEQVDQYQTDAEKLLGIEVDGEGNIWFVDGARNEVSKLVVDQECEDGSAAAAAAAPIEWPDRECTMVVDNDLTVDVHAHSAGYMNLTGFLGISDYADAEVHHCGGNSVTLSAAMAGMPTADESGNYRMNNDALLMEGYMCHVCLP